MSIWTLLVVGAVMAGENGVEVISEIGIGEFDDFFAPPPLLYIPQCLTSGSLFQTSPFTMVIPQFQPLFQTPLLCTEPHQLPIGHPSHIPQDLGMRSLKEEYCYIL